MASSTLRQARCKAGWIAAWSFDIFGISPRPRPSCRSARSRGSVRQIVPALCYDEAHRESVRQKACCLNRSIAGSTDGPPSRGSQGPRAGRGAALFRPHCRKDRVGRSTRRTDGRLAPGPGVAAGRRPAAADERHLHPGDGLRQSGTAAGQPGISRLAVVLADTRARAAARWQLEDPARRWAEFQFKQACSSPKSGGELHRPLHQIAGADPEPLQTAQGDADSLKILDAYRRLRQQAEVPLMHRTQLVAQLRPLFSQMNVDRTTVVGRALLREIPVLDHLFDVVRDVRAEIAAPQGQLAYGHLGIADIKQHHPLDIVDVMNPEPFQFELHYLQKMTVQAFDERNHFEISVVHPNLRF